MPEFLMTEWLTKPMWMWLVFLAIVVTLMILDLGILHKKHREIGVKESLIMSGFYAALGFSFAFFIWFQSVELYGDTIAKTKVLEYITGYVVEYTLAMDNIFVIAMIFILLPHSAEISAPRAAVGHFGRHHSARHHDWGGRHAGAQV